MVRIQAQTMLLATPQRTAESRWVAPTPMIEPVMVWVVLTGMPPMAVPMSMIAPAVSAQKPPIGRSLVSFIPMVLTMRQPPARVPSADGGVGGQDHPHGNVELGPEVAGREEEDRDDPHRLLRVVGAVAQAVGGGGERAAVGGRARPPGWAGSTGPSRG